MKLLPIGTEDFKKIIDSNYYYIDKTKSIEQVVESSAEVMLFTRPRRFGKTLFMSTLDYFYNVENKLENKKLFKNLYIEKSPCFKIQGTYPVINITMKNLEASNMEILKGKLRNYLQVYINKIKQFHNITSNDLELLERLNKGDEATIQEALLHLSRFFYQHYNKKVIILIDEYEAPLINAIQKGYQNEALDFFRSFYSSALKTNPYLEKAIVSGITRISQASIFSGLNNFTIYDHTSIDFADAFGFTQDEVSKALDDFNLNANEEIIKEYYDGYHFGSLEIYNPWSIINYLDKKKLDFYWTRTSNIEIIYELLQNASIEIKQKYLILARGEELILDEVKFNNLVLKNLTEPKRVFDFMIACGYLNYNLDTRKAKIVNKEILNSLPEITENGLFNENDNYLNFKQAIRECKLDKLEKIINLLFQETYSYFDFPKDAKETNYHIALATLLAVSNLGEVKSNLEAGLGRFDISLLSSIPERYSYIIEVKRANKKSDIDKLLDDGLKQIKANNYIDYLKNRENKAIVCFCFYQKEVRLKYEVINSNEKLS